MGKRSDYEKAARDLYPTPQKAVVPLLRRLRQEYPSGVRYAEPCCGDGRLVGHISRRGVHSCVWASDIEPLRDVINTGTHRKPEYLDLVKLDALDLHDVCMTLSHRECDLIITNPPWSFGILSELIENFTDLYPTWLLLNADLMHNQRMIPYLELCSDVVSVGRVSWMENGTQGMENCAWYKFDRKWRKSYTRFYRRIK